MRKTLIAVLIITLALVFTAAPAAFAAENTTDNYETTYTVKVYPGLNGTLATTEYKGHHYGETFKGNLSVKDVKVNDGSRYYVKGFRLTGHDNNEYVTSLSGFAVTEDVSYEVAYGVKGKMVSYTAKYVDKNGKTLASEDTFYGNIGDKPTVAYKYVSGYMPASYTMGKTLSETAADNVFEFIYTKTEGNTAAPVNPAAPGNANQANAGANGGNGGAAGGGGVVANNGAGANNAGGANTTTIGNDATPLANGPAQYTDLDNEPTPTTVPSANASPSVLPFVLGGIAALIAAVIAAILIMRRRSEQETTA